MALPEAVLRQGDTEVLGAWHEMLRCCCMGGYSALAGV